jgi:hypothetical protein
LGKHNWVAAFRLLRGQLGRLKPTISIIFTKNIIQSKKILKKFGKNTIFKQNLIFSPQK